MFLTNQILKRQNIGKLGVMRGLMQGRTQMFHNSTDSIKPETTEYDAPNVLTPTGPYGISKKDFVVRAEGTGYTSAKFYPVDQEIYQERKHKKSDSMIWWTAGKEGLDHWAKIIGFTPPSYSQLMNYRVELVNEGPLHRDFADQGKKMTPVIISHGYIGFRNHMTAYVRELVSYGCMVFTLDHTDRSGLAYKDYSQSPAKVVLMENYDPNTMKKTKAEYHAEQLDVRTKDIRLLIEEIKKEGDKVDMSKLAIVGHSFGAMTAIESCKVFRDQFSLGCAIDPFLIPREHEIVSTKDYSLHQPLLLLSASKYHSHKGTGHMGRSPLTASFDSWGCTQKLFGMATGKPSYNLIISDTNHCNSIDYSMYLESISRKLGIIEGNTTKYDVFVNAVAAFFGENGFLPVEYLKTTMQAVEGHTTEFEE